MSVVHRTSLLWMLLVGPLGSLPAPVSAQCGELTWIEAINQALDANQALVAARQALDAQHKDVAIARSSMLPSLGFIGYGQFSKSTTFSSSDPWLSATFSS